MKTVKKIHDKALSVDEIASSFRNLQNSICSEIERVDGRSFFSRDLWERPGGGGGESRIIQDGNIIEKGGVNFSSVHGELPDAVARSLELRKKEFLATGISIVLHPVSPMIPIVHMNVRFFEIPGETIWFGGGIDVTPHYVSEEDARFFHGKMKEVCDRFDLSYYSRFKKWADDYFFIPHRNETRGIGGIFFDRLSPDSTHNPGFLFRFVYSVGESFVPVYRRLVENNSYKPYGEQEKRWQELRRGRYVEFNLVCDRGTQFGLQTGGRTESVLMSLPATAGWKYDFVPEKDSHEERTLKFLRKGIDWVS